MMLYGAMVHLMVRRLEPKTIAGYASHNFSNRF
jgi:hypothetical protein